MRKIEERERAGTYDERDEPQWCVIGVVGHGVVGRSMETKVMPE